MKLISLFKFYHEDMVVKIIQKEEVVFTGKVSKVSERLLKKNVYDINPTINNCNKIVVELRLGKGEK